MVSSMQTKMPPSGATPRTKQSPDTSFHRFGASDRQHQNDPRSCPSPLFTDVTISDTESMSSSSHDAFYLEKYSDRSVSGQLVANETTTKSTMKKTRPSLNIMTNLSGSQAQACDSNLSLDQVRAKKVGPTTRPKSVVSAKAEHFHVSESEETDRSRAYTRLKALASVSRDRKLRATRSPKQPRGQSTEDHKVQAATRSHDEKQSDAARAIMIGIQVPEHAAAFHQAGDSSAITLETPATPAIVITPARSYDDSHPILSTKVSLERTGAASSIYSSDWSQSRRNGGTIDILSAVPAVPEGHAGPKSVDVEGQPTDGSEARHKSQGWWNLALSPMLSRAGTRRGPDVDVPPVPEIPGRARANTYESQTSPQTPRRLGLAGIRASIWSHWTTEHKQPLERGLSTNTTFPRSSVTEEDQKALLKDQAGIDNVPQVGGNGLAAEYYHACAIEQLSGQAFFECQNHSCADQWPIFKSIYDEKTSTEKAGLDTTKSLGGSNPGMVPMNKDTPAQVQLTADITKHLRSASNDSADLEFSPNIREAEPASVLQAKSIDSRTPPVASAVSSVPNGAAVAPVKEVHVGSEPGEKNFVASDPGPPVLRQQSSRYPNIAAIVSPHQSGTRPREVDSPGPISPELQRIMAAHGDVPMTEMRLNPHQPPAPTVIHNYYHYPFGDLTKHAAATKVEATSDAERASTPSESDKGVVMKKPSLLTRIKSTFKRKGAANKQTKTVDTKKKRKHRCIIISIFLGLLAIITASILLAMFLRPRGDRTPTQTQWLNLTGYPPVPVGISTIIRPNAVVQNSQCVQPQTMWSCSVTPDQQSEILPNDPNQPNFRFEIKFRNGTVASNMTLPAVSSSNLRKRLSNPFADTSFDASPVPPSQSDQIFLGNTTDGNAEPVEGEETPFYISFVPAFPINPSDISSNSSDAANNSVNLTTRQSSTLNDFLPKPDIDSSGLAAAGNLLPNSPFATNQPIHLYNRGLPTEHFGFYMYYDRSIFLSTDVVANTNSSLSSSNSSNPNTPTIIAPDSSNTGVGNPSDASGGSARLGARSRCTWAQTRFLVQIFTSPNFDGSLLGPVPQVGVGGGDAVNSAVNYTPPGSFPYPTSITLDRHGGNVVKKSVYCYEVDEEGKIVNADGNGGRFVLEQRSQGGELVNPAPSIIEVEGDEGDDLQDRLTGSFGGIDGGTGGCACRWQNWR